MRVFVHSYGSVIVQRSVYIPTVRACVCEGEGDLVANPWERSNVMHTVYYCDTSLPIVLFCPIKDFLRSFGHYLSPLRRVI